MLPSVSDLKLAAIKNKWDESMVDRIIRQIEKDVDLARKLGAANLLTNMKFKISFFQNLCSDQNLYIPLKIKVFCR